jgi:hypothetical protein
MRKRSYATFSAAAILACACASGPVLEGRVVARDARYGLVALATHPQDRVLFMRVERGGHPRFVKLAYRWFDSRDALPEAIGQTSAFWRLRVRRDPSCDESVGSIPPIRVEDANTGAAVGAKESVQYLQGAPSERIPDADRLECYRIVQGGWRSLGGA